MVAVTTVADAAALRRYLWWQAGSTAGSITGMKVSVSLPAEDVAFLDDYARAEGFESRSAVLHKAVGLLKVGELSSAYADAWRSWGDSDDALDWESTTSDGLEP